MANREIVSVCYGGFPGTNRHLREVSQATALSRHLVVSSRDPSSVEVAFLRDHLAGLAPRLVIFGSWHVIYEPLVDAATAAGAEVAVFWTSSAAQTDFGGETATLAALLRDPRVTRFFAASDEMVGPLGASGRPSHALPHAFSVDAGAVARPAASRGAPPVVSLFCSPSEYRRKNVLACLIALAELDVPYVLHVNGLAEREEYRAFLENLKIPYRDLGWMYDAAYAQALDEVDLGLQVSLADSFNYVVAEHFVRAVPVVVSHSVPCAHGLPEDVLRRLVVDDPDNPAEIRQKIRYLLSDPDARGAAGRAAREHVERLGARNAEAARRALLAAIGEE